MNDKNWVLVKQASPVLTKFATSESLIVYRLQFIPTSLEFPALGEFRTLDCANEGATLRFADFTPVHMVAQPRKRPSHFLWIAMLN
jgi:hypothetical protein